MAGRGTHLRREAGIRAMLVAVGLSASLVACSGGGDDGNGAAGDTSCADYIKMSLEAGKQEAVARDYIIAQGDDEPSDQEVTQTRNDFAHYCAFGGREDDPISMAYGEPVTEGSGSQMPPSEPELVEPVLSYEFGSDDGYSYIFEVQRAEVVATKDVENATPGNVNIEWSISYDARFVNTTAGRNTPVSSAAAVIVPVWSSGSAICRYGSKWEIGEWADHTETSEPWCMKQFYMKGFADWTGGVDSIPVDGEVVTSGTDDEIDNPYYYGPSSVPEDQADEVLASMLQPDGWVLAQRFGGGQCYTRMQSNIAWYITAATFDTECVAKE